MLVGVTERGTAGGVKKAPSSERESPPTKRKDTKKHLQNQGTSGRSFKNGKQEKVTRNKDHISQQVAAFPTPKRRREGTTKGGRTS